MRAALALLWHDFALYGASAEDSVQVDVLRDYGLTVDWHVAASQASEEAWEHNAEQARDAFTRDLGALTWLLRSRQPTRHIGWVWRRVR